MGVKVAVAGENVYVTCARTVLRTALAFVFHCNRLGRQGRQGRQDARLFSYKQSLAEGSKRP